MTSTEPTMKLIVCLRCDRNAAKLGETDAGGREWFRQLKKRFAGRIEVTTTNCLGGCEYNAALGVVNGCCSVGLMGEGKYGYVLNQLMPGEDDGKVEEFVRRYGARVDGKLGCGEEPELKRHIATRLPPL